MQRIQHLFLRILLVALLTLLQACGLGGGSSDGGATQTGNNDPVDTSGNSSGGSGSGSSTSGGTTSGDTTSGDTTSGDTTSGDTTSGDTTSGDTTSGDTTSGDTTSGDTTSGDTTSGDTTSGGGTSGNGTSGDGTTGGSTSGDGTSDGSASGDTTSGGGNTATGDASHGATLYENQCASCHGTEGAGPKPIDATKMIFGANSQALADYIVDTMPPSNTVSCSGNCASDIAAYIEGWASAVSGSDTTPQTSCGVTYGPRSLRVLTRSEFVNSIEDLTGVNILADLGQNTYDTIPADNMVNGFSNNVMTSISSGSLQAYTQVVDKVVERLALNGFADIIDCSQLTADVCAYSFIENYIPRVIRRPLTEEETIAFESVFASDFTGGEMYEGLALALRTLFTSPQFLYRDETGVSVAEISSGGGGTGQYEQTGNIQTFIDSSDEPHTIAIFSQEGRNASFTGDDLITITVRGTRGPENGLWPTMSIESNNEVIGSVLVDHTISKTYQFHTTAFKGDYTYFTVINKDIGAPDAYKGGHNLIISKLELSGAQEVTQTLPDVALDADSYILTPYQLASYLAFTFTGSTPDETLLLAAADKQLETKAQIAAQVMRLLRTRRAREHFGDFAAQWLRTDRVLNLAKDPTLYPNFTNEVRQAMAQEVREVFNHVVLDEGEPFSALYDGDFTFANSVLADFYGIGNISGSVMQKVTGVTSRAGLVTSGAFLAVHAHEQETGPILRATYLRRRFLCHDVPIPPTGVSLNVDFDAARAEAVAEWEAYLAANNGLATSRRKYEFQTSAEVCQSCHGQMLNPLGGGFEDFDAVGLPQTQDYNGLTIDSNGIMYGVHSLNDGNILTFNGGKDFAHQIANLDVTRQCFVDTAFRMAMGTGSTFLDQTMDIKLSDSEIASYTCEVQKLDDQMKTSVNSPLELLKALGTMDSVHYRKDVAR